MFYTVTECKRFRASQVLTMIPFRGGHVDALPTCAGTAASSDCGERPIQTFTVVRKKIKEFVVFYPSG